MIVTKYVSRNILLDKDRLPAISALAKEYAKGFKIEHYIAGLWCENLHQDLIWETSIPGSSRTIRDVAPSWSWASVKFPPHRSKLSISLYSTNAHNAKMAQEGRIIKVYINTVTTDLYGGLMPGSYIVLRGNSKEVC